MFDNLPKKKKKVNPFEHKGSFFNNKNNRSGKTSPFTNNNEQSSISDMKGDIVLDPKYICCGCEERATAKDGTYCEECDCFVHNNCQKERKEKEEIIEEDRFLSSIWGPAKKTTITFIKLCPVCKSVLNTWKKIKE